MVDVIAAEVSRGDYTGPWGLYPGGSGDCGSLDDSIERLDDIAKFQSIDGSHKLPQSG